MDLKKKISGHGVAMITPFNDNLSIDFDSRSLRNTSDLVMIFSNFISSYKKCPTFNYIVC